MQKKFTIIIPTIWKSEYTLDLLESYQKCEYVSEIILINNKPDETPLEFIEYSKIIHYKTKNIYVNPSWNFGVSIAKNENILISNDDVLFKVDEVLEYVSHLNYDVIGVHSSSYSKTPTKFNLVNQASAGGGWGCLIFVKKSNWIKIPENLKIWYGDNWIIQSNKNVKSLVYKNGITTKMSTSAGSNEMSDIIKLDTINWYTLNKILIENWQDLLNKCKKYKRIVVSGPQRSGTTYTAKQLSEDLNYIHVDEFDFGINYYDKFLKKLKQNNVVVQAPALTHELERINLKDTLVIWMSRDFIDIEKSEDKINWHPKESKIEFKKYLDKFVFSTEKINSFSRSAPMKTYIFENVQCLKMKVDWIYVSYNALQTSSNYVSAEKRKNFKAKQINSKK